MERGSSRRITYLGFLLAIALVLGAAFVAYRNQKLYQLTVATEAHTYIVLETSAAFVNEMLQGESSARAYVLTRDTAQRRDSERALALATPLLDSLRALTRDNPAQRQRLDRIGPLAARRVALIKEITFARDSVRDVTKRIEAIVHTGDAVMHQLRKEMIQFKLEELRLLDLRTLSTEESGTRALIAALSGVGLALLILLAALSVTFKELHERERAEGDLQHEAERQAVMIEMQQAIATAPVGDQAVLDLIVEQAMHLSAADGAMLAILDPDQSQYTVRSSLGNVAHWRDRQMELHSSIIGWVTRHREATMIPDAYVDDRVDQTLVRALTNRSLVVLPILEGDRAVGALLIASLRVDAFTQREFSLLKIMSGILSAGITNAAAFAANERLLSELRASRDAAEEANQAKSAFLATMSHELRTPLNSVIGFANILLRNKEQRLDGKELQYLTRIKDNGTQLLHLINDVLDVSKIEAGRMEVHLAPTEVGPLILETVAQLEPQARERGVPIATKIPAALLPVDLDATRFRQVLINLIGNALKFTERGSVTIVVAADAARHPVRVDVVDTGIGIPPDRLAAVFEAFTQAESTTERRFGGTGLGLTISRALLRLMGADLTATSKGGEGSTFSITLPVPVGLTSPAAIVQAVTARTPLPPSGSPRPCVLIIDDEADSRALLRTYLEEDGYRTAEATDGAEGLAMARELRPALITLDLRMPLMSGFEVLRRLKIDPDLADIPVVIVSIEAADHRGSLVGPVDVLAKPVEREALLALVERTRPGGRRRVLIVDDDPHTRQLYFAFLGAEGYLVRTASDGLGALTLMQSEVPDLVLLDLMMPVMDGGTLLSAIRGDPRFREIPVAVITALDADSEAVRRLDGVAQAVIQKGPALEESLHQLVDRLIGPARS